MTPSGLLVAGVVTMAILMTISLLGGMYLGRTTSLQIPEKPSPLVIETEVDFDSESAWMLHVIEEVEALKETVAALEARPDASDKAKFDLQASVNVSLIKTLDLVKGELKHIHVRLDDKPNVYQPTYRELAGWQEPSYDNEMPEPDPNPNQILTEAYARFLYNKRKT